MQLTVQIYKCPVRRRIDLSQLVHAGQQNRPLVHFNGLDQRLFSVSLG